MYKINGVTLFSNLQKKEILESLKYKAPKRYSGRPFQTPLNSFVKELKYSITNIKLQGK